MNEFFLEKYKDHLELGSSEFKPLIDLFSDMLMVDVYFFCGMINANIDSMAGTMALAEFQIEVFDEIIKKGKPRKMGKFNKTEKNLLVDHFNNLLDIPYEDSYLNKIWDILDTLEITLGEIGITFCLIRGEILKNLKGSVNITKAISEVMIQDIERKNVNRELLS